MQYWANGPADVSINDICKKLRASKPGIYREFGSDDGLKAAALQAYQELAIEPFLALFKPEQPLFKTLEDIVAFLMQDRDELGVPKGCLFVTMRAQRDRLGPDAQKVLDKSREQFLTRIGNWATRRPNRQECFDGTCRQKLLHTKLMPFTLVRLGCKRKMYLPRKSKSFSGSGWRLYPRKGLDWISKSLT